MLRLKLVKVTAAVVVFQEQPTNNDSWLVSWCTAAMLAIWLAKACNFSGECTA